MAGVVGFIQIPGIQGLSTDANHKGWVEVTAVSHGTNRNIDPSQSYDLWPTQSKVQVGAVTVKKVADISSPLLVAANCEGKIFPDVTIDLVRQGKSGKEVYYQWKLKNVFIESYDVNSYEDDKGVMQNLETVNLRFGQVNWTFRPSSASGPGAQVEAGWSVANSKRIA